MCSHASSGTSFHSGSDIFFISHFHIKYCAKKKSINKGTPHRELFISGGVRVCVCVGGGGGIYAAHEMCLEGKSHAGLYRYT